MDRRCAGGLLMAVILVAVLCVPGILGRSLPGRAVPGVHVDPRPQVGDCLGPLATPDQLNSVVDLVPHVPCGEPHSAEVLAVGTLDPKTWPKRPTVTDATFTGGPLSQHCDQVAGRFLGWGSRTAIPRIQVSFFTRVTVPGDIEWQLGQRWYSCELMPGLLDYPISYTGTARDASIGTPPGAFASCAVEPDELPVSCDRPHHAELLTRSFGQRWATTADCVRLTGEVMQTPDPTFGGQLAVISRTQGSGFACWVTTTSTRSLVATLINHGAGPLPFG